MWHPKTVLKLALQRAGYQIRKTRKAESVEAAALHLDAFYDQQYLLRNHEVKLILDLGAHVGQTAQQYHQYFPKAKIISFEPFPDSFRACHDLQARCDYMEAHNLAIADVAGPRTFYTTSLESRNSLLKLDESRSDLFDASISKRTGEINVQATTLDDFCAAKSIDHIDILKMDIQGGELLALKGAKNLLARAAIELVFLEVSFTQTYDGHPLFFEIYQLLHASGFTFFDFYDVYCGNKNLNAVEANALFTKGSL
jgi:FkbM family methyltransferase